MGLQLALEVQGWMITRLLTIKNKDADTSTDIERTKTGTILNLQVHYPDGFYGETAQV
jgi:hypothetical protein